MPLRFAVRQLSVGVRPCACLSAETLVGAGHGIRGFARVGNGWKRLYAARARGSEFGRGAIFGVLSMQMRRGLGGIVLGVGLSLAAALAAAPLERGEAGAELLVSDDVAIWQGTLRGTGVFGGWTGAATLEQVGYELEYRPVAFDFTGRPVDLSEGTTAARVEGRRPLGAKWEALASAGFRDGFSNYRSLWLAEYFEQRFSELEGVPGAELYRRPEPAAASGGLGLRWEYVPSNAFARIGFSHTREKVAPGYEIDFDGVRRGRERIESSAVNVASENVLSPRLRSRVGGRATKTSERSWRYSFDASLNAALGEAWTLRMSAGGATESPGFEASFGEGAVERRLTGSLSVVIDARYYEDSGEIEDAFLFTTAAPGTSNRRVGIGLRYEGDRWQGRAHIASSEARYEATNPATDFFQNLYQDRRWTNLQLAVGKNF